MLQCLDYKNLQSKQGLAKTSSTTAQARKGEKTYVRRAGGDKRKNRKEIAQMVSVAYKAADVVSW